MVTNERRKEEKGLELDSFVQGAYVTIRTLYSMYMYVR